MLRVPLILAVLGVASPAWAAPGAGTIDDPVAVDAFPYAVRGDTATATSRALAAYSCAPSLDESGPEVIYRFSLTRDARVTAWVEGDGGGVDIDVHLLADLAITGGVATSCTARGDVIAEADLAAGTGYVVVDTFGGDPQAGRYVLRLEAIGDAWIERPIADGVVWRARRYADLGGAGPEVVHELVVDPAPPAVTVRALDADGCATVGTLGAGAGAVAGINGGYFSAGCAPVSLLVASGVVGGTNSVARGAFGLTAAMTPLVAKIAAGATWPAVYEAHGGGPILAVGGVARAGAAAWADEGLSSAAFLGPNPRTVAAADADGRVHLVTVDGRRGNAAGLSLDQLAAWVASPELGLRDAVNLDGGGSTTLWIAGATPNGVVNYPADGPGQELATHPGSRPVSGGFFVFAPPFDHPPRFQTTPVANAQVGLPYRYDADAIDLDVDDVVTFGLVAPPPGMTVDAADGIVTWTPTAAALPRADVTLSASDGRGGRSEQVFVIDVDDPGPPGDDATGCGCRTTGGEPLPIVVLAALATLGRRRRTPT